MVEAADEGDLVPRPYNMFGYDSSGSPGPGVWQAGADPALLAGPFCYSANGLTESCVDRFGVRPEFPTAGQASEMARPWRYDRGRTSATIAAASVGPVGTDIVFGITVHVVLEQQTNIIAVCDLETLGISFHSETREGASQAWLGFRDGTGVALTKLAAI